MNSRTYWFSFVFLVLVAPWASAAQEHGETAASEEQVAHEADGLSEPGSLFASNGWNLELSGQFLVEAWDFNHSKESLLGGTIALGYTLWDRWEVNTELSFMRVVHDTGYDVLLPAVSSIIRWRAHRDGRVTTFLEIGPGVSYSTDEVPYGGTRFNFILQAGGGMTYRVVPRVNLIGGLRWFHVSNNGLNGRSKNPDIQALGMYLGWIVG